MDVNGDKLLKEVVRARRLQGEILDHVPDRMENNASPLLQLKLLPHGYLLAVYKNSSKMLLAHCNRFSKVFVIENPATVLTVIESWPHIISLHKNNELQVYNLANQSCVRFEQRTLREDSGLLLLPFKDMLLGVSGGVLLTWKFGAFDQVPSERPLNDAQLHRVIHNAKQQFTCIVPETSCLQIGTADTVQIWDIVSCRLLLQASTETERQTSFMIVKSFSDTLVTVSRTHVRVWPYSFSQYSVVEPFAVLHEQDTITTSVVLDDSFLICGDNHGVITLRRRRTAELIYVVNGALPFKEPTVVLSPLINLSIANKVNVIRRLGRYIVCGFEHGYAAIYDIHEEKGDPVQQYRHPTPGTVAEVEIQNGIVLLGVLRKTTATPNNTANIKKPEMIVWAPKLTGFDFYYEAADQIGSSLFMSLYYSYTRISGMLSDYRIANPKDDIEEFSQTLDRVQRTIDDLVQLKRIAPTVDVPFQLIQALQSSLDSYDESLAKLQTSGKLRRFLDNNRLRREIEKWNSHLAQRLQKVDQELLHIQRANGVRLKVKRRDATVRNSVASVTTPNGEQVALRVASTARALPPRPASMHAQTSAATTNSPTPPRYSLQLATPSAQVAAAAAAAAAPQPRAVVNTSSTNEYGAVAVRDAPDFDSYENIPTFDRFGEIDAGMSAEVVRTLGIADDDDDDTLSSQSTAGAGNQRAAATQDVDDDAFGVIVDEDGRLFWKSVCGLRAMMMDWPTFYSALLQVTRSHIDERVLRIILDNSFTGFVSQYKFGEFLKGFGPLASCINNVNELRMQQWFHGFLTSRESEMLLETSQPGTYLVRFSKSTTGSFALAYKSKTKVLHIFIQSALPDGFKIKEVNTYRLFKSLTDIILHYGFVLKQPFASRITEQPWFQGDLNKLEAHELLDGRPPGTFLVRFSSGKPGSLALSFVMVDGDVRHARICNTSDQGAVESEYYIEGEYVKAHFMSVTALIDHHISLGVLTTPYS